MDHTKKIILIIFFAFTLCHGFFWDSDDSQFIEQVMPDESMNQKLVLSVNYNPIQVKAPFMVPDNFLSNVSIKEWRSRTSSLIYDKRYLIGTAVIAGCYIYACHYLVSANKYLEQTDTWSSWRLDTSVDLLITIPQNELAKELVLEIQRRYSSTQNPTDFISPLITFIQTIDTEINTLKRYMQIYQWATKLCLHNLLPFNQKLFNNLGEKYRRNIYLKNIFLSWAADYKVNHNKNRQLIVTRK
jgi:hypothetical protein